MKIVLYNGRYWLVEEETFDYPSKGDVPAFFAAPIWEDKNGDLEMRRAGANWIPFAKEVKISSEQKKQLKKSIKDYIDFFEKHCGKQCKEYIVYSNFLKNNQK